MLGWRPRPRRPGEHGDKYEPSYDGVAELWFDDIDALLAARQSPEWKASSDDEANFIDLECGAASRRRR